MKIEAKLVKKADSGAAAAAHHPWGKPTFQAKCMPHHLWPRVAGELESAVDPSCGQALPWQLALPQRGARKLEQPSDRLRSIRSRKYATATEAAKHLSVPLGTYIQHENGSRNFKLKQAKQYADHFEVDVVWLVHGQGEEQRAAREIAANLFDAIPKDRQEQALAILRILGSQ